MKSQFFDQKIFNNLEGPMQKLMELNVRMMQKLSYMKPMELWSMKKPEELLEKHMELFIENSHMALDYMRDTFNILENQWVNVSHNYEQGGKHILNEVSLTQKESVKKAKSAAKATTKKVTDAAKSTAKKATGIAKTTAKKATVSAKTTAKKATGIAKTTAKKATGVAKTTAKKATDTAKPTAKKASSATKSTSKKEVSSAKSDTKKNIKVNHQGLQLSSSPAAPAKQETKSEVSNQPKSNIQLKEPVTMSKMSTIPEKSNVKDVGTH